MVGKNKMKDWKAAIRTWEKDAGFKSISSTENESNESDYNNKFAGFKVL